MDSLFSALYQAQAGAVHGLDMVGRSNYPTLAVVTANEDPQGRRRIKVSDPVAPSLESDWVRRLQPFPGFDPPLPKVGSTVIVFYIDGVVTNGWYLQCVNNTNPPLDKASPLDDLHSAVPGERNDRTNGNQVINVGKSLTLKNDAGASITLTEGGDVVITDSSGGSISLSGGIDISTSSLTKDGVEVALLGATDNRGHDLVTSGQ